MYSVSRLGSIRCFLRKNPQKRLKVLFMVSELCDTVFTGKARNKTETQEGNTMKDVELRYVGSHVEVYTGSGVFLFSADTVREAMEELAG